MICYLPVFYYSNDKMKFADLFKGIAFRFQNGNHNEQSTIFPVVVEVSSPPDLRNKCKELARNFDCHIGILLSFPHLTEPSKSKKLKTLPRSRKTNMIDNFILISPSSSPLTNDNNIFHILLVEWEQKAIKANSGLKSLESSDETKGVIESFKKCFKYKPPFDKIFYIISAYDAADIAIKTLLEAGPQYEALRHFLLHTAFKTITTGKIGFNDKGMPYLIGKSADNLFPNNNRRF